MDAFLNPAYEIAIQNIPRIFTAIAEWLGCLVYIAVLREQWRGKERRTVLLCLLFLPVIILVHMIDGILPLPLWMPGMLLAITTLFLFLHEVLDQEILSTVYLTAHAFLFAELMASLEWQLYYYWAVMGLIKPGQGRMLIFALAVYLPASALTWKLEKPMLESEEKLGITARELFVVLATVLITFIFSNLSFVTSNTPFSTEGDQDIFYVRTLVDLGGFFLLYSYQYQRRFLKAKAEADALQNLLEKQYDQYRMSKENVDLINRKYHDLKHKLQLVRLTENSEERKQYLSQMEDEIKRYEVELKTGNEVLDIMLTSKNLAFKENGITFLCIADGSLLSFMDTMDICSIIGNALDNSMESVLKLSDKEKRIIRMKLCRQQSFIVLSIENSCDPAFRTTSTNLRTTKLKEDGYHGYGLKSIELSTRKYGGTMAVNAENGIFALNLLFPVKA